MYSFIDATPSPLAVLRYDAVVVKFAVMINGFTYINITKLDVLSKLKTLQIATEYLIDGKPIATMPASIEDLKKVTVKYETLPGWETPIDSVRKYEDLPENARKYVERIEELAGVKAKWIGVGAGRDAMIIRDI